MRRIIVEDESDEEDKAELPNYKKLINEIVKKHNIYTYNDIHLCNCEIYDFLNNYNMSEEESEYIDEDQEEDDVDYSTTHNKFIIKPIEKYTNKLIKNLMNIYKQEYKIKDNDFLQLQPFTFEKVAKLPKKLQYIKDIEAEEYQRHSGIADRIIDINVNSNHTITYKCIDVEKTRNYFDTNNIINRTTKIKTDTDEFRDGVKWGEYFEIQRKNTDCFGLHRKDKNYKNKTYTEKIYAIKILRDIYIEQIEHLEYHYYDMEWEYEENGWNRATTTTILAILITNRVLRTITKHIKFYKRVKEFKRKTAIKNILRSKTYNYGLGLKLSMRGCGLELTNS